MYVQNKVNNIEIETSWFAKPVQVINEFGKTQENNIDPLIHLKVDLIHFFFTDMS